MKIETAPTSIAFGMVTERRDAFLLKMREAIRNAEALELGALAIQDQDQED